MVVMARIAAMGMRASAEAPSEASSGEDSGERDVGEILIWGLGLGLGIGLGLCEMKQGDEARR